MTDMLHRRVAKSIAVTALVALAATGCAREAAAPGTTKDGGVVHVVCGATEDWCAATTKKFTETSGLKADFVRLSSGEALARIKAGKGNAEFDVWYGGPADGFSAANEGGFLEPYVSPNAAKIPAKYKDANGAWTGVYVGALGFCSNTKLLQEKGMEVPKSWADLLNPKLAKDIGIAHPSTSGTAYTALWTQVQLAGGSEDKALDYMRKLHPNVLQYTKSGAAPAQMTARGEVAVGVIFSHDCIATKEAGFPGLEVSFPSEGTGYETGGVALIQGAKNPVSGKKFVDWALTKEAQEVGPTAKAYQFPTNPDAKVSDKVVDLAGITMVDYDAVAAGKAKIALTKRFDAEVAQAPKS
ncbi:iron(III) transport system substrate-binding protein [Allocatelliglobosispora scoriae]|uniref:Iron(III) transport system substrate-binding protein n=1 Tax=Allocatelliglobosispora scoriae TaxID=643052 RepID=A0A841C5E5_9ACTN|nr:ABC transporter substrate-binding protein [Allocatelliglobosispora scoriae]MBB5874170.1 iron(III) transport system substrate-binding protein [Allocatelliglobosispora scoriae]